MSCRKWTSRHARGSEKDEEKIKTSNRSASVRNHGNIQMETWFVRFQILACTQTVHKFIFHLQFKLFASE